MYVFLTIWKLYVSLWKCNMSRVMMEYIYVIWSIRDNCYDSNRLWVSRNTFPGFEDPLQRQPQEHRPGLLSFLVWMNCHHELEADSCCLLFSNTYTRWLLLIGTQWTVPSTTLSLGLDRYTWQRKICRAALCSKVTKAISRNVWVPMALDLFKRFCGP